MKAKPTTTPTPAQREQYRRAYLRHLLHTADPDTVRAMYAYAERATTTALKYLHSRTPLDVFRDLQNQYTPDTIARNAPGVAEQLNKLKAEKRAEQQKANEAHKIAKRIRATQQERDEATAEYRAHTEASKRIQRGIDTLQKALENTLSLRADLVHVALLQALENILHPAKITPELLASHGHEPDTDPATLDPAERREIQKHANFRKCVSAVAHEAHDNTTPDANTKITTKPERITPEQAQAWIEAYASPDTWESVKVPRMKKRTGISDCFDTLEHRSATDEAPAGWYIVRHWRTVSPIIAFNIYTDTGEEIEHGHTQNPYVSDQAGAEQLEDLANRANLTDRERAFVTTFCNPTARQHGAEARTKYLADWYEAHEGKEAGTKREQERREQGAGKAEYSARVEYSCNAIGITNLRTQQRFLKSLFSALDGARAEAEPRTPEEKAQAEYKAWERMQSNKGAHIAPNPGKNPDFIAWAWKKPGSIPSAPDFPWKSTGAPVALSEAEKDAIHTAERHRAETATALHPRLDLYRELRDAPQYRGQPIPVIIRPDDTNRHSAKYSAFAFYMAMDANEQYCVAHAHKHEQEQAKRKREAWRKWKSLTFEEYGKLSEAERERYKRNFEKLVEMNR